MAMYYVIGVQLVSDPNVYSYLKDGSPEFGGSLEDTVVFHSIKQAEHLWNRWKREILENSPSDMYQLSTAAIFKVGAVRVAPLNTSAVALDNNI